jgi:hypothetical protein
MFLPRCGCKLAIADCFWEQITMAPRSVFYNSIGDVPMIKVSMLVLLGLIGSGTAWGECIGPSGGDGGGSFNDGGANATSIAVHAGAYIDGVEFGSNPFHGGGGGSDNSFQLEPGEVVIGVQGRYGAYVDSLQIITNKRTSPKYGGNGGVQNFLLKVPAGERVVGFCGRSGAFIDAIGIVTQR